MRTKKRVFYLLMTFCLMVGQMSMQVQAEEEPQVEETQVEEGAQEEDGAQEEEGAVTELSDLTSGAEAPVAETAETTGTGIRVAGVEIVVDTYYKTVDGNITEADASDYNVYCTLEGNQYVLTLNNATINGQIYSSNALKIVLEGSNEVCAQLRAINLTGGNPV